MILGQLCSETMRLEYITKMVQPVTVKGPQSCEIEGLAYDSRQVRPGYLFVALHGHRQEGADFIADALKRGAVAVVADSDRWTGRNVTTIVVKDTRQALAEIACAFYEEPSSRLQMIGITGTNGKTTTSFMARDILNAAGRPAGLIGTIRYEIGQRSIPAARTTPEAPDIQAMLDRMLKAGCRSAVMEVSSHGLDQKRVWGIDYDVGVFTNLTQDHLDYHETMEKYFAAKTQLFRGLGQMEKRAHAVINMDDPWGMQLANTNGFSARLITFGLHPTAMVMAEDVQLAPDHSTFRLVTPWGSTPVRLKLPGGFNVSNALAAAAATAVLGVEIPVIAQALEKTDPVPGRLERIPTDRGFQVFVDYAHTPDALENVLTTLRSLTRGRLIVVFGCGGSRDRGKRPLMGGAAAQLADHTVLTSDNPRNEDPAAIIAEIEAGMTGNASYDTEVDREKAIFRALSMAKAGDLVVVAGKGHENCQEFADTVVPFDDREVVRRLLMNL
ncbi:MAG: UDP-N-acetylmuramoyl-L-alanyl-D-glutamate--2,6-diaminopimelate ligase [Verrucomicrobia bacterium ADurb.Bin345]|nr:MAG: UDP-N-acetylmuramoyl-L-alanyl-D-glutamate--2,6-diaminopimelate ligase [Verrucomicrobia bacterium ADurb.Bin345]